MKFEWQKVVGMRLTKWLYLQFSAGATKEMAYKALLRRVQEYYDRQGLIEYVEYPIGDLIRRAKASVLARWTEYNRDYAGRGPRQTGTVPTNF